MKSKITKYTTIIFGLLLLVVGLYLRQTGDDLQGVQGIMRVLPYVCIGLGSGLFGHGMGNLISERAMGKDPDLVKKNEYR